MIHEVNSIYRVTKVLWLFVTQSWYFVCVAVFPFPLALSIVVNPLPWNCVSEHEATNYSLLTMGISCDVHVDILCCLCGLLQAVSVLCLFLHAWMHFIKRGKYLELCIVVMAVCSVINRGIGIQEIPWKKYPYLVQTITNKWL